MVMRLSEIVGHTSTLTLLEHAMATCKIAPAYLFCGPSGVGRRTTALALAAALNCEQTPNSGCTSCNVCVRIASGDHPDVIHLAPDGAFIKIGQIRALEERLAFAPHEAKRRVIIVEGAETLHPSAANALLKSIEEPPLRTHFILIASSRSRVLPTIISRCQRATFAPLAAQDAQRVVEHALRMTDSTVDGDLLRAAIGITEGSPGQAIALINSEQLKAATDLANRLSEAAKLGTPDMIFKVAASPGRDRPLIIQCLEVLQLRLRELLWATTNTARSSIHEQVPRQPVDDEQAHPTLDGPSSQAIRNEAQLLGFRAIARQIRQLDETQSAILGNTNPAMALEGLALAWHREYASANRSAA